jgi:hypothetical protein
MEFISEWTAFIDQSETAPLDAPSAMIPGWPNSVSSNSPRSATVTAEAVSGGRDMRGSATFSRRKART